MQNRSIKADQIAVGAREWFVGWFEAVWGVGTRGWKPPIITEKFVVFLAFLLPLMHESAEFSQGFVVGCLVEDLLNHGDELGVVKIFIVERAQRPCGGVPEMMQGLVD